MKRTITGLILLAWGGGVVARHIFGDAPSGTSAYNAGRMIGFVAGVAMAITGLVVLFRSPSPTDGAAPTTRGVPPGPFGPPQDPSAPGYLPPAERIRRGMAAPASGPGSKPTGTGWTVVQWIAVLTTLIVGTGYLVRDMRSTDQGRDRALCEIDAEYRRGIEPLTRSIESTRPSQLDDREKLSLINQATRASTEAVDALEGLRSQDREAEAIREELLDYLDLTLRVWDGLRKLQTGECLGPCQAEVAKMADDLSALEGPLAKRVDSYCAT